jgi:hypothetical protein
MDATGPRFDNEKITCWAVRTRDKGKSFLLERSANPVV